MKYFNHSEVVVIGGGLIGAAIAYYLSEASVPVILLERNGFASETSGACSGKVWLATKKPGLHTRLARISMELLKGLIRDLSYVVECNGEGEMVFFETEQESRFMKDFVKDQRQAGADIRIMAENEIRKMQPALAIDRISGATYSPFGISINPMDLVFAFVAAAERLGARVCRNTNVEGINVTSFRVRSVLTNRGEIKCNFVVNAAGVHAPSIGKMVGLDIPIVPMRGQILVTEPLGPIIKVPAIEGRYLLGKRYPELLPKQTENAVELTCNVSQSSMGNVHIGASRDFVGHRNTCSAEVVTSLARRATRFFPDLAPIRLIRSYAGLRPQTSDGLPIIGKADSIEGFMVAAGHGGDGVTLAAITGKIISEIITGGEPSISTDQLSLTRFH